MRTRASPPEVRGGAAVGLFFLGAQVGLVFLGAQVGLDFPGAQVILLRACPLRPLPG